MKKVLFFSAAALATAIGMSSFKKALPVGPYYFEVNAGKGTQTSFRNADVTYLGTTNPLIDAEDCPGAGKRCVITVAAANITVTSGATKLKTLGTPKPRQSTVFTRLQN